MKSGICIRANGKTYDLVESPGDSRDWLLKQKHETLVNTAIYLLGALSGIKDDGGVALSAKAMDHHIERGKIDFMRACAKENTYDNG